MSELLLAAKLCSPQLPSRLIPRGTVLELLESSRLPDKRLTLISAPAGYGKTTVVCEWMQNISHVCWLSLEKSDNDPRIFFTYLVASLQKAFPHIGKEAQGLLDVPQMPPLQVVLTILLNDLAASEEEIFTVLDDYQSIKTSVIHDGITFLLDHLPPGKHIIITTRSDPALPLHRYRSRGQMVEIRAENLRFSQGEISSYMEEMASLHLKTSDIAILEKRTEGWAAGLQMAAISMRGKSDPEQFIRSLAGTNRHILDYLLEEVLNHQTTEVQAFLIETSILERLCPPLCDALLQAEEGTSQRLLQYLEHENLFTIPLDEAFHWYRYHHLFRDLLTMRLKHTAPEKVTALHRRAAEWFVSTGEIDQAVLHYMQAKDFEPAAELVEQHALELFVLGRLDQLVAWTQKLPAELSARRPWLCVYQAWTLAFAGKNAEAENLLGVAMQAVEQTQPSSETKKKILAEIYGIRALLAVTSGNLQEALRLYALLDIEIPAESLFARSVILWGAGYAWRMQGQLAHATQAFHEVLKIGRQLNNLWTMSTGYVDLGMVLRLSGRLTDADALYREGLDIIGGAGTSGLGYIGRLESFLASTLYEQNLLDEAMRLIASSIAHNELWRNPNHVAHAYMVKARILMGKGERSAEDVLRQAVKAANHPAVVPTLRLGIDSLFVQFWLANGQHARTSQWLENHPLATISGMDTESRDLGTLTHARVLIAQGKNPAAWKILEEVERDARAASRIETLIKTLTLKALAAPTPAAARKALEAAINLGIPKGYIRTFLDEGDGILSMLKNWQGSSDLVKLLLGSAKDNNKKVETMLTARESDILRGMAEGLSNKEIGQRLFISAGTVKAHSSAIYRKLGVENRTEAIARAKDIGLI